ncbi:hypothetical protein [Candidatus Palauibacter sp.]|uniref:hypothetical protein n=1 Tax=Candidatus Palauibacter sp. TaxID=3101350 RepID=UPI003B0186D4
MLRFTPFSFVVFHSAALRGVLAALAISLRTSPAGPFRRVVATALLLSITSALAPFTPLGHAHAEEAGLEAAAVQGGCPPYVSGGPNNPDSGVRSGGSCVDVPVDPKGFITCEVCFCWYEMDDGRTENFSTFGGCSSTITIYGPADDPCTTNKC